MAESVLEIKKLLQTQQEEHKDIISQMAKLIDTIDVPSARAAVLWVVGEYCRRIPLIAPDVLRKLAKSFCAETEEVKVQVTRFLSLCINHLRHWIDPHGFIFRDMEIDAIVVGHSIRKSLVE